VKTSEDLENFMLKHGENIIDTLGAEVDRLEKELKVQNRTSILLFHSP
jgi:zinc transporter 9